VSTDPLPLEVNLKFPLLKSCPPEDKFPVFCKFYDSFKEKSPAQGTFLSGFSNPKHIIPTQRTVLKTLVEFTENRELIFSTTLPQNMPTQLPRVAPSPTTVPPLQQVPQVINPSPVPTPVPEVQYQCQNPSPVPTPVPGVQHQQCPTPQQVPSPLPPQLTPVQQQLTQAVTPPILQQTKVYLPQAPYPNPIMRPQRRPLFFHPRQLCPYTYGNNFCHLATQQLFAQHISAATDPEGYKQVLYPRVNHIYNKVTGKKENIDTLLASNRPCWERSLSNEWGQLAQGNKYSVLPTDTIEFIAQSLVPKDRDVTYAQFVCDYRPLKSKPWRVRIVGGGDRLTYPGDPVLPACGLLETKVLLNSVISDAKKGA